MVSPPVLLSAVLVGHAYLSWYAVPDRVTSERFMQLIGGGKPALVRTHADAVKFLGQPTTIERRADPARPPRTPSGMLTTFSWVGRRRPGLVANRITFDFGDAGQRLGGTYGGAKPTPLERLEDVLLLRLGLIERIAYDRTIKR